MVQSSSSTEGWEKKSLAQLVTATEHVNLNDKKYCFVWDRNGNVPTFFNYKGQLVDLDKKILGKTM